MKNSFSHNPNESIPNFVPHLKPVTQLPVCHSPLVLTEESDDEEIKEPHRKLGNSKSCKEKSAESISYHIKFHDLNDQSMISHSTGISLEDELKLKSNIEVDKSFEKESLNQSIMSSFTRNSTKRFSAPQEDSDKVHKNINNTLLNLMIKKVESPYTNK